MDRKDFKFISGWIEKDSTVLDLGCGDSTLLNFLRKNKNVKGYGFEKDIKKVQESIKEYGLNLQIGITMVKKLY